MPMTFVPVSLLCHAFVTLAVDQRTAASATPSVEAATAAAECSFDLSSGAFQLPNVTCYSTFAAPESGTQGRIVARGRQLRPPTLLQVSLLSPVGKSGGKDLCGLDATGRSDRTSQNIVRSQARSTSNATLMVRRGVDRRWLVTSSFVDPAWYTVMAWTNASLRVLFDPLCSGSSDQLFVQEYIPAWSICRRLANGSSVEFEGWNSSTLFAQDQRLAPWVMLPNDYECSGGKDYELIVSSANAATKLTVTLYTRPGKDSCRMLCIAEWCDGTFLSDHLVGGNQSLTIRYQDRSTASKCDSGAYTGFALVLLVNPESVITLTTYVLDSPFNALDVSFTNNSLLISICVAVALIIIVVASIVIARWRACRSRRVLVDCRTSEPPGSAASVSDRKMQNTSHVATPKNDGSLGSYSYAAQSNGPPAAVPHTATGQKGKSLNPYTYVAEYNRNSTSAACGPQLLDRSCEISMNEIGANDIYAEIDDIALSTEVPRAATALCCKAQGDKKDRFLGNSSLADSKTVLTSPGKLASNTYATLDGRTDVHAYSVPAGKLTSNHYTTLDGRIDVHAYSVPTGKLTSNQYTTLDGPIDVHAYSVPIK